MKLFKYNTYDSPTKGMYAFTAYNKDGSENESLIGDLYLGSIPAPSRNIPYWALFSNEPSKGQDENAKSEYDSIKSKVDSNLGRLQSLHSRVIITSHLDKLFNSKETDDVLSAVSYLAHSFLYTGGSETEVFKDSRNLTTGDHFVFPNNKSLEGPVKGLLQEKPTHALARRGSSWTIYGVGEDKKPDFNKPTVRLGI